MDEAVNNYSELTGRDLTESREIIKSIFDFTQDEYVNIRDSEIKGKPNQDAKNINKYISDMPSYKGEIYRGLSFNNEKDLNTFLTSAMTGGIKTPSMSSFSSDKEIAEGFSLSKGPDYRVVMTVTDNKRGKSIKGLSVSSGDNEVIVPKNTKYKVNSVTNKDGFYKISLSEN